MPTVTDNRFAQLVPPSAPTAEGFLLGQTWDNSVIVPLAQNIGFGIGFALLAFIGGLVAELELTTAGRIALIVGGVAFALLMIIRSCRDEVRFVLTIIVQAWDRATQAALRREIGKLTAEIERIKSLGLLSDQYAARDAAEQLLYDFFLRPGSKREQEITRRGAAARNMKRADWEMGVKLLKNAGVLNEKGMIAPSYTAAISTLSRYLAISKSYVRTADGDFTKI